MSRNPKVIKAFKAMAELGISEKQVKPALKHLLKVFDKNWGLIEAESYRVLIDAIFEAPEAQVVEEKNPNDEEDMEEEPQLHREPAALKRIPIGESSSQKKKSTNADVENDTAEESPLSHQHGRPLKRLRKTHECQISLSPDACNPMLSGISLIRPKVERDELPGTCSPQQSLDIRRSPESRAELQRPISPHLGNKNKGKQLVVSKLLAPPERSEQLSLQAASQVERSSMGLQFKEKIVETGIVLLPKKNAISNQLLEPKDEPFTDDMAEDGVPIAVILPDPSSKENPVFQNGGTGEQNDQEPMASKRREHNGILASSDERSTNCELANIEEESPNLEVASSPLGEVKLSFSCTPAIARPDFHMPNLDAVLKLTEEKFLHSYKITDPNFSLKNMLGHMCKSFLELGTNANSKSQDGSISISPSLGTSQKSMALDAVVGTKETLMQSCSLNGTITIECPSIMSTPQVPRLPLSLNGVGNCREPLGMTESNDFAEVDKDGEWGNSHALVVVQQSDLTPDELRSYHDMDDITRGEEKVNIPWVNDLNSECPPGFYYINKSLIFRDADVHVCLTDIGDGNCCGTCYGNCLSVSAGCACASHTGGEFAYMPKGLVKEDFLEECISVTHNPQYRPFYCKSCPLERVKDDDCFEPCKGHLRRKFIKECWKKCGCNRQCGNRVVQRGLNCKLQVFYTSEKGWGLRTLEELPKGAFVCEYAGEVLTCEELHERNIKSAISGKRPYPVLLDANWGSKADMRNEEALSLDATNYGNVARFINHRCLDANLVGIPVEVEAPGRYYYHLAFFTTRKVDALEELNRDYGIDFDDHDHPVKVFQCKCGSKFCRNMKRPNRSRSASIAK